MAIRPGVRDERAHPVIKHMIEHGYLESGDVYVLPLLPDHATANQARLSVNRAARHLGAGIAAWVTDHAGENCWQNCADPAAPHGCRLRIFPKNAARRYVNQQAGGDPEKLRYNPYRKRPRPMVDPDGQRIPVAPER